MKTKPSPRGRIHTWKKILRSIEAKRKTGVSLERACVVQGIAYSTYHEWKRRKAAERTK